MRTSSKRTNSGGGRGHLFLAKVAAFFCFCLPEPTAEEEPGSPAGLPAALRMGSLKLRRLCSRLRGRPPAGGNAVVRTLGRASAAAPGGRPDAATPTARIATFNAAMFSIAPAVPRSWKSSASSDAGEARGNLSQDRRPKSILKQRSYGKSKLRVSINLPHNEISLVREKKLNSSGGGGVLLRTHSGKAPMSSAPGSPARGGGGGGGHPFPRSERSILEVLREVNADILALQNVKAEEENGMSPLSDLAEGLGMRYVFAESWAPQYGNAVLSRWPIKRWKVQKISDDADFRSPCDRPVLEAGPQLMAGSAVLTAAFLVLG